MMKKLKKWIYGMIIVFILMNILAIFHSYRFTHFINGNQSKTNSPEKLSWIGKVQTLIMGIKNPRPQNEILPNQAFSTVNLKSNQNIECWDIPVANAKGTVILFHGFNGSKSAMLDKSQLFNEMGYSTFLVDFMGSGGSEGNQTTIGYHEAAQVKTAFDYLKENGIEKVYLLGSSMGAAAVMKAMDDYTIMPNGIILECPFGTMYKTVAARFKTMNVPAFPMAGLLVFWGGIQNNFWAFNHNPETYAQSIKAPVLLMSGAKDVNVSLDEINIIYNNIPASKILKIFENSGHESYLNKYKTEWMQTVDTFLSSH